MKKKKLPPGFVPFLISFFALAILVIFGWRLLSGLLVEDAGGMGTVIVPDVVGKSVVEAKSLLGHKSLVPDAQEPQFSKEVPQGYIIMQDPHGGTKVRKGRKVLLIVSAGEQKIRVPNVTGKSIEDARTLIEQAGFEVGEVREEYDEGVSEGFVIEQAPDAEKERYAGQKVKLLVSRGKAPRMINMPRVTELSLEDAKKILEMNDIKNVKDVRIETGAGVPGYVVSQSVLEGVRVLPDQEVVLYVAQAPSGVDFIDVRGVVNLKISAEDGRQEVVVVVFDQDGSREVYRRTHETGETVKIPVSGIGKTHVKVFLDGVLAREQTL